MQFGCVLDLLEEVILLNLVSHVDWQPVHHEIPRIGECFVVIAFEADAFEVAYAVQYLSLATGGVVAEIGSPGVHALLGLGLRYSDTKW